MAGVWKTDAESAEKGAEYAEEGKGGGLRFYVPPFPMKLGRMGHPKVWGEWRRAVALGAMPTLATIELSRRWGTRRLISVVFICCC
jgi:hypothetical protein